MAVVTLRRDFRSLARAAASAADDKKAFDILLLDIHKESDVADYVVLAGANSAAQMRAVLDAVEESLQRLGAKAIRRDGGPRDRWLALDYGGLVVHILLRSARDFYRLENLWENAKRVSWNHQTHRKRK